MPSLADHQSNTITKLLLLGDSGSGKTGALTSLVEAGYKLRILDYDNGLDSLAWQVKDRCSDKLGNISFVTLRDRFKASDAGPILDGPARAYTGGIKLLNKWEDGTTPAEWGADHILVLDSLTLFSDAAWNWAEFMNPTAKDKRQIYGAAQDSVESIIGMLTGVSMQTNVIVIAHVAYQDRPDGTTKGFPMSLGKALSPKLPAYFNSVAMVTTTGAGQSLKRQVQTLSSALVDLKNPASFKMAPALPIESALATFFKTVRG